MNKQELLRAVAEKAGMTIKDTGAFYDAFVEVVKEQIVEYGKNAVAPKAPTKEGYKFTGWDVKFTNVQADLEVTAQFEKKSFTVTFLDALGKEISKQTVLYQEAAVEPENYDVEGYEFIEWDTDFSSVTKNITVCVANNIT